MSPSTGTTQEDPLAHGSSEIIGFLRRIPTPLYAIVDTSHDHRFIATLLKNSGCDYSPLFGKKLIEHTDGRGPYLISLHPNNGFIETLVGESCGKAWCVYLTGETDLGSLRRHLSRFVTVKLDSGNIGLFRFYDPRVLRLYLPTCSSDQLATFFGPIKSIYLESHDGALTQFTPPFSPSLL